ncbi:MAG TPA: hypothetical protein VG347_07855 [Verrucomicrobiae bacterium]|nr:hypothetical protein [Verrucomicrobiae bacterium]
MDFFSIAILIVGLVVIANIINESLSRRKFASMKVLEVDLECPNNHHVLGVGYYHAAAQKWFPYPWNEYREDRGYYWNGTWNPEPDQRMVAKSTPPAVEVARVNEEWRKAGPAQATSFWATVEREGFGTAIRRSEGS